jgi:Phosphoesterase family
MNKSIFFSLLISTVLASAKPNFTKVMMVVLENTNYSGAMAQPFLSDFAKKGALLSNMSGVTHPSQGNYIAMVAGDTLGVTNDANVDLQAQHIGDLLEAKGLTWKAYVEDYPGNCFLGGSSGAFARKHVPFLSFKNVSKNPSRCKNIVNSTEFDKDVKNNTLPNYSLFIPNLKNDGHDTGVTFADSYMSKKFGPLLKNPRFMDQMLFVITFDESASKANQIYTAVYGDDVVTGAVSKIAYNHYSILKTIENAWSLGTLGKKDQSASAINDILK